MGKEFLETPVSTLYDAYLDSSPHNPLLIALCDGSDVTSQILKLAKDVGVGKVMIPRSLIYLNFILVYPFILYSLFLLCSG